MGLELTTDMHPSITSLLTAPRTPLQVIKR